MKDLQLLKQRQMENTL